jgi:hypothetical protein
MGTIKIVSENFVDYLHLSRCSRQWKTVNAL